jgi:hypothetical protein
MHTHDEVCAEMPIPGSSLGAQGSVEEFERLLVTPAPDWASPSQGLLPIAAKVFECESFKKG